MARIHEETPEGLAVIQERFGNRVLIEVVDSRDPAKTVSLNFAEGVIQWKQEIERGPAIERLHAHLDVMRREGRTTPDFELQARGKVPELGRERSSINSQIGDQSGRTSEDRKAGILKPLQGLELERAQENAVKFRTAPQAERLADPKLNGAAKVLAVLNAHIDAAHQPRSQENQKAKDIAVSVLAARFSSASQPARMVIPSEYYCNSTLFFLRWGQGTNAKVHLMNMQNTISVGIDQERIERVRDFVRNQNFIPMTDKECEEYRFGIIAGAHSNAIEDNPFDAEDWALFDMLIEERATAEVCINALHFFHQIGSHAQRAA